jgi:hypothetical protein
MMVEEKVNRMFQTVKFRMFNTLINGSDEPACDCLINGVPFSDANHASQINSGIEIINVFSDFYGTTAPIFIDNAEAVNEILPTKSQSIRLTVTTDETLTIN